MLNSTQYNEENIPQQWHIFLYYKHNQLDIGALVNKINLEFNANWHLIQSKFVEIQNKWERNIWKHID